MGLSFRLPEARRMTWSAGRGPTLRRPMARPTPVSSRSRRRCG